MKRPRLTKLTIRRVNQRKPLLPHETTGCDIVLLRSDPRTYIVKERLLFHNHGEEYRTPVPGWTHYIVLPNWLR